MNRKQISAWGFASALVTLVLWAFFRKTQAEPMDLLVAFAMIEFIISWKLLSLYKKF
jgi:hypothetical protein